MIPSTVTTAPEMMLFKSARLFASTNGGCTYARNGLPA
jgi:hypothetical protein